MEIDERSSGNVTILDLRGKLTIGDGDELLKDKINSLVQQGQVRILLNLADVPYVDSAGLGQMVSSFRTVTRSGGALRLLNLTARIEEVLTITKLLTVFDTYESESEALASFG